MKTVVTSTGTVQCMSTCMVHQATSVYHTEVHFVDLHYLVYDFILSPCMLLHSILLPTYALT